MSVIRWLKADKTRLWYVAVLGGFVVAVWFGITTSSVGISHMTFDGETHEDVVFGTPKSVRSDEWMRNTTQRLGIMKVGSELTTPLSVGSYGEYGERRGIAAAIVYADNTMARLGTILPNAQLFAFLWWLPYLVIALSVPYILRFFEVRPIICVSSTVLVLVSPAITWWTTMSPLAAAAVFGMAALVVASVIAGFEKERPWLGVALATFAGVLGARAVVVYPRWTIPLLMVVVVPLVFQLVAGRRRRTVLRVIGIAAGVAAGLLVAILVANYDAVVALSDTVSPGRVRVPGGGIGLAYIFSAPFTGLYLPTGLALHATNPSEMATGFLFLVMAIAVFAAMTRTRFNLDSRVFVAWSVGFVLLLVAWAVVPWPQWSSRIPVMNLLKTQRVAQIVGIGGMVLFGVMLDRVVDRSRVIQNRTESAILAGVSFALLIGVGFSLRANQTPQLSIAAILVIAGGTAFAMGLIVRSETLRLGLVGLIVLATVGAALSYPLMKGLGDLRGPESSVIVDTIVEAVDAGYLATDTLAANAFVVAEGVPTLSGDQAAPSPLWKVLDPTRQYDREWNRSALIAFDWNPDIADPIVEQLQIDILVIHTSPCSESMDELDLTAILSRTTVDASCLELVRSFRWQNRAMWLYAVGEFE